MAPPKAVNLDAILPMTDEYMQQIVRGEKTYEFRRYLIAPSVERIWVSSFFYHMSSSLCSNFQLLVLLERSYVTYWLYL